MNGTPSYTEQIHNDFAAGMSILEIANKYKLSRKRIHTMLKCDIIKSANRIVRSPYHKKVWKRELTPELKIKIKQEYKSGYEVFTTEEALSEKYRISLNDVKKIVRPKKRRVIKKNTAKSKKSSTR